MAQVWQNAGSRGRAALTVLLAAAGFGACTFPSYVASDAGAGGAGTGTGAGAGDGAGASAGSTGAQPSQGGGGAQPQSGASGAGSVAGTGGLGAEAGQGGAGEGGSGEVPPTGDFVGPHRLVAMHSAKCADADFSVNTDGKTTFGQRPCDQGRPQSFHFVEQGNGYYALGIDGTAECAEIENKSKLNKAVIVRAPCDGKDSQSWIPVAQDDGAFFLINRLSGKCLDVTSYSEDDVVLQQFTCNVGGNQRWAFVSLTPAALPFAVDDLFRQTMWRLANEAPYEHEGSSDATACDGERAPGAVGKCHSLTIATFAAGQDRSGSTWLYPVVGSWGTRPGLLIAPGASKIRFQARGAKGGEKLSIKAGGVAGNGFDDPYLVPLTEFTLTTEWQSFFVSLAGKPYTDDGVISAFAWRVDAANSTAPISFYLDDIAWE